MPLVIPDDFLREAGLQEGEALREFACQLFNAGKLTLWRAAQLAQLDRVQFEEELRARRIPIYRPTIEDLKEDLEALDRLGT
jgi:predicted HTH domain antitoxin